MAHCWDGSIGEDHTGGDGLEGPSPLERTLVVKKAKDRKGWQEFRRDSDNP